MQYQYYNPNPQGKRIGDCVIRAICKATGQEWDKTYMDLCLQGLSMSDMPSSNAVWGAYLKSKSYERKVVPTECEDCYTVERFCDEHPNGTYLLAISGHLTCCCDGVLYDAWDSSQEIPIYFWQKVEEK